jgi:ribonuclease E
LQVLRALEEQLIKGATHNLIARTRPDVAQYVLNQKRAHLRGLEERFAVTLTILADASIAAPQAFVIDRGDQVHTIEAAKAIAERAMANPAPLEGEDDLEDASVVEDEDESGTAASAASFEEDQADREEAEHDHGDDHAADQHGEGGGRRRRRRRRRGRGGGSEHFQRQPDQLQAEPAGEFDAEADHAPADDHLVEQSSEFAPQQDGERGDARRDGDRRRRRGRRGGRRNRHRNGGPAQPHYEGATPSEEQDFAAADSLNAPPAAESELNHAVADLDAAPPAVSPAQASVETPQSAETEEPVRRRSTVRERPPLSGGGETPEPPAPSASPSPAAEPVVSDSGDDSDAGRPRRTGWWSRRFAGG